MPSTSAATGNAMQDQLLHLFLYLGSEWVLYLLLILSVLSVTITIERCIHFYRQREDFNTLHHRLQDLLATGKVEDARTLMASGRSHVARIMLAGLEGLRRGPGTVEELVASATLVERLKMERGLAFLGTLGNNAPFIGLFGTVLGIIRAFRDLATNTIEGSSAVMAGIAEALVATAVGLFVALPAVAVFNAFQRTIRSRLTASDAIARVLLAFAKSVKE